MAGITSLLVAAALALPASAGTPPGGGRSIFQSAVKRAIPDSPAGGGVLAKVRVPRFAVIDDLDVGIRINHSSVNDLNIYLVSPQGKFVELSTDNGGNGNNYGVGPNRCTGLGAFTVFSDEEGRSIRSGSAPFAGPFRPQTPLRALDGDPVRGIWRLMVFDDEAGATGTIGCFALSFLGD